MGQEAQFVLDKTAKFTEKLYDMTEEQIEEFFKDQGKDCNKILYIEYKYYQIGKTEEWLENISAKIGEPLTVRREILLQRLHGSSLSPYPREDIEYITDTEKKPIREMWLLDYFKFDIYEELRRDTPYIVSIDCSTGTNGDSNAITILNPYTVKPDAEFECSYIGETKFEQLIIELVKTVIPRACVVIERNSVGDSIVDHLLVSQISNRLYFDKDKDLVADKMESIEKVESMLKHQASIKTFYGVYTGVHSRETMFAILSRHVNEFKENFVTHNIIRDLTRLVKLPSGKIAAGNGFHDDSIMSYLIGLYVYYHGNNLALFGIVKGEKESDATNEGLHKKADEINPTLVAPEVIQQVREQELKEEAIPDWEEMMADAIRKSQKETFEMSRRKAINGSIFDNSADTTIMDYEDNGSIDMSFFDEMNGM